jgi:tetratricopeptide (TPR) repeat protein
MLFSVADDHTLKMWLMSSPVALATASDAGDEVWGVATESRGKYVATVSKDGFLRVYDALTFKNTHRVDAEYGIDGRRGVLTVAFSPDGNHLAAGDGHGYLTYYDLTRRSEPERVPVLPSDAPEDRPARTPAHKTFAEAMSLADKTEGDQAAYDKITVTLTKAIADDPKNALNHVALARVLRKRSRATEGGKDHSKHPLGAGGAELEKAFALSPKLPEALLERAWTKHGQDDDVGARVDVLEAQRLGGASSGGEALLAELDVVSGKTADAETHAVKAVQLSSRSQAEYPYRALQDVYWRQGDLPACFRAYELRIDAQPWSAWAKGNFASTLLHVGELDRAIEVGTQAVAQRDYGMARVTLANAYAEKGADALWFRSRLPEAKASFDSALGVVPTHALSHYGLGAYYRKLAFDGNDKTLLAKSSSEFELALRSDPKLTLARQARDENAILEKTLGNPPRKSKP